MLRFGKSPRFAGAKSRSYRPLVWLLAVLVVLPGCGPAKPKGPNGTVHGKVTRNGNPVPAGTMLNFTGETSSGGSAKTAADGTYRLVGARGSNAIPVDKYKVVVMPGGSGETPTPEQERENMMRPPEELPKTDSGIPDKYQNLNTTPEAHEVKEGDNEINIDLAE